MMKYRKLVRDNIPAIIEKNGQTPILRVLEEDEYISCLKAKLQEEVKEFLEDSCIEEICDIYEVLDALKKVLGYSDMDIEAAKSAKAMKNGKFDKRLFLERVTE